VFEKLFPIGLVVEMKAVIKGQSTLLCKGVCGGYTTSVVVHYMV
jgi:fluoride ion exporter CrcB/FEX